jgi:hypothetical protein
MRRELPLFLLQVSTRFPTRQSEWRQISSRERDLPFRGSGSREQSRCRQPLAVGERMDSELYS